MKSKFLNVHTMHLSSSPGYELGSNRKLGFSFSQWYYARSRHIIALRGRFELPKKSEIFDFFFIYRFSHLPILWMTEFHLSGRLNAFYCQFAYFSWISRYQSNGEWDLKGVTMACSMPEDRGVEEERPHLLQKFTHRSKTDQDQKRFSSRRSHWRMNNMRTKTGHTDFP